ncbi:MAG: HTH domain-containing protein [Bacteroidales bacterium]|jgi:DNA-directed RNA polymerase delta subunit|nr:HTH domain-containing protein [Bacteroidales bacterium]
MEKEDIRDILLDTMIVSTEAQLKALKKLRGAIEEESREKGKSQTDLVFDILNSAREPLHISQIIAEAQRKFGVELDRESLVSALSKKVMKEDRFVRTGKNTFALKAR